MSRIFGGKGALGMILDHRSIRAQLDVRPRGRARFRA
jgi:hypothetical protein